MQQLHGHSNIVDCQDIHYERQQDGIGWKVYIRMELLTPLKELTNQGDLSETTVIELGKDICRALVACQERDIVHRDIKPENIMASSFGFKLGDFGIARTLDHTTNATITGTERYIAPEVIKREKYGREVDIYSLGLVLYWLLNNRRMPFWPQGDKPPKASEAQTKRLQGGPLPAPVHGSPALKKIVLKDCAYKPKDRYSSAREMLTALEKLSSSMAFTAEHSTSSRNGIGNSGTGTIGGEYSGESIKSDAASGRSFGSGSQSTAGNGWEDNESIGAPDFNKYSGGSSRSNADVDKTEGKVSSGRSKKAGNGAGSAGHGPQPVPPITKKKKSLWSDIHFIDHIIVLLISGYAIGMSIYATICDYSAGKLDQPWELPCEILLVLVMCLFPWMVYVAKKPGESAIMGVIWGFGGMISFLSIDVPWWTFLNENDAIAIPIFIMLCLIVIRCGKSAALVAAERKRL